MKLPVFLFLAIFPSLALSQSLPRKINCGDLNGFSSNEPGYELLSQSSNPSGISLSPAALDTVHVAGNFPNFYGFLPTPSDAVSVDPDQLAQTHRLTSLKLADFTVLSISNLTPNTKYRIKLELGASFPWVEQKNPIEWEFFPTESKQVRVEIQDFASGGSGIKWRNYAKDIRCTTPGSSSTYQSFISSIVNLWVLSKSDSSGVLRVRLSTDGTDPLFLSGLEIHKYEALPVYYKRVGGNSLQGSNPAVAPFVTAFNAKNYASAETLALGLTDPFNRGVALAHLIGWNDGSRDGFSYLIQAARAALEQAKPTHAGAAFLIDELSTLQRALDHRNGSGYAVTQKCPSEGGKGFLNPNCAGQIASVTGKSYTNLNAMIAIRELRGITAAMNGTTVLNALKDWNSGLIPDGAWEPSPLVFSSLKLIGTTLVAVNPMFAVNPLDPDSVAMKAEKESILHGFVDLGFAAADFPKDIELPLFGKIADHSEKPSDWSDADLQAALTDAQIASSWWGSEVATPPGDAAAPLWANLERDHDRIQRRIARYWLVDRMVENELGGGWGDDIELIGAFSTIFGGKQYQTDRRLLDAMDHLIQYGWETQGDTKDGYQSGFLTDVEHSAEYTADPYLAMRALFGQTARAAEFSLGTTKHIFSAANPSKAWAGITTLGRLHFKSEWFNSEGPGTEAAWMHDALLNGRATIPGVSMGLQGTLASTHPLIADLTQWAKAWRDDALDTTAGKPKGWYGNAQWPSNAFGASGYWWSNNGSPDDASNIYDGVYTYTLELMRMAYRSSTASDRWKFLLPAVRMFRDVKKWEEAGEPSAAQGSAFWAAGLFRSSPRFGAIVIDYVADLQNDATLNSTVDPQGSGGATYVDAALIAKMKSWVELGYFNQGSAIKYALGPLAACKPHSAKGMGGVETAFQKALVYYRAMFPLVTKYVIHTDRVFLKGNHESVAAHTGAAITEGLAIRPLLRWERRLESGPEFSVLCNFKSYDGSGYSAFAHNFDTKPIQVRLLLEEGLLAGKYLIETGPTSGDCDLFPSGASVTSFLTDKLGTGAATTIALQPGLNLVRVFRQGAASQTASNFDLAIDPPQVHWIAGARNANLLLETKIVNLGNQVSPASTLKLYAGLVTPEGAPLLLGGGQKEVLVATLSVPAIDPPNAYQLDQEIASYLLPLDLSVASALSSLGYAVQVRAELASNGLEKNLLNNDQTRAWTIEEAND